MKKTIFFMIAVLSLPDLSSAFTGVIIRIIDGDSLLVNNGGKTENVRLIGIDAPESGDSPKAERDAAREGEALTDIFKSGKEAAAYLRGVLHPGESVTVETDVQARDAYGRLLAYVYLSGGGLLNEKIMRAGFAVPMVIRPNVRFENKFRSAYEWALKNKKGLWGKGHAAGLRRAFSGRYRRKRADPLPGPQGEVTDQKNVTDQTSVSGKPGHFK